MPIIPGYRLDEQIHEGTHRRVYRGVREKDGMRVVVKVPKTDFPSAQVLAQLKNEFTISARLGPEAARAVALEPHETGRALVMEDFGGDSLRSLMRRSSMPAEEKLRLSLSVARALDAIHAAGIIHKDIKPGNILVSPDGGRIILADFSISSAAAGRGDAPDHDATPAGTLTHMSPEQTGRMNRGVDYRSDYYSLGVTLYELFTGKLPFESEDPSELLHGHIARNPLPPDEKSPDIPACISRIIMKLLAKNADDRYQSSSGLIADLESCLRAVKHQDPLDDFVPGLRDMPASFTVPDKLYGRRRELGVLKEAFERVRMGAMELVLITGSQGMGKTALAREIQQATIAHGGYFAAGAFDLHRRAAPHHAFIQAFKMLTRRLLSENEDRLSVWRNRLYAALGANAGIITETVPEVEHIIGPQTPPGRLPPAEAGHRFNSVVLNFMRVFPGRTHPLVLFLDNLESADSAGMTLIKTLTAARPTRHLLIIGTIRSEALSPDHPLLGILEDIRDAGTLVTEIPLPPLGERTVTRMVSEALRIDLEDAAAPADAILERTGGNPFFLRSFLSELHERGLITTDKETGSFTCDIEHVRNMPATGSMAELMLDGIGKLPPDTVDVLKCASCIGIDFNIELAARAMGIPSSKTAGDVWKAVRQGLVLPAGDSLSTPRMPDIFDTSHAFRFSHERVRSAAHSLLAKDEARALHGTIGRIMLEELDDASAEESIYEIAEHLNIGCGNESDPDTRLECARINFEAGRKAKTSAAFDQAAEYYRSALNFLDPVRDRRPEEVFEAGLDLCECEFCTGTSPAGETEKTWKALLESAPTLRHRARAYNIRIVHLNERSRYAEAVALGIEALTLFNISIPDPPSRIRIGTELLKALSALKKIPTHTLEAMHDMTDPVMLETMRLLMNLITPAYHYDKELTLYAVLKMVNMSLKNGNCEHSAYGYMFLGMFLSGRFGRAEAGYKLAEQAMKLNKRFRNAELDCRLRLLFGSTINHWQRPIHDGLDLLAAARDIGTETGDTVYSRYAGYFIVHYSFLTGMPLDDVFELTTRYLEPAAVSRNIIGEGMVRLVRQTVRSLKGRISADNGLDDDRFNLALHLERIENSGGAAALYWSKFAAVGVLFRRRDHRRAFQLGMEIYRDVEKHLFGMYLIPSFHLYMAVCAASSELPAGVTRRTARRVFKKSLKRLRFFSEACPDNFEHMHLLAMAEDERIKGNIRAAIPLYDRAMEAARREGAVHDMALAGEQAAEFHLSLGNKRASRAYLMEALYGFTAWGAEGCAEDLRKRHSSILSPLDLRRDAFLDQSPAATTTTLCSTGNMDSAAVVKASAALSGEIELDRLIRRLMRIVMENAGARLGHLLLMDGNTPVRRAEAEVDDNGEIVVRAVDETRFEHALSQAVVNYAARTRRNVVLADASATGRFADDPYIRLHRPKSVLCIPVLHQGNLSGILYLENDLAAGVFTSDRIEILSLVSSQAAGAIRNAGLYNELKKSEREYRTLMDNISLGVYRTSVTAQGPIIRANPAFARIFGFDCVKSLEKFNMRDAFRVPSQRAELMDELKLVGEIRDRELSMQRRDGTPIQVSVNMMLMRDKTGTPLWLDGVIEDITEKQRARELERLKIAADSANKAKSEFLAGMSHEIRTPMNAMLGTADLLWESPLDEEQKSYVSLFRTAGENLLALINDILDLSKVESGRLELESIPFDLENLMAEVGRIMGVKARERGLDLNCEIDPEVPLGLRGDPGRLRQIMVNLIGNALKFTHQGEVCTSIRTQKTSNETCLLEFSVRDTGTGIPPDKLDAIFETFTQADSSTTRKYGGTGLGLAICRNLVHLMNGEIRAESQEGSGSTFSFTALLDITPEQPRRDTARVLASVADRSSRIRPEKTDVPVQPNTAGRTKILLAEDSENNRMLMEFYLGKTGHDAVFANNGLEALKLFREDDFDIVFMDMQMPVMDGIEATRAIRAHEAETGTDPVPIVALTANAFPEDRERFLGAGCTSYLPKPIKKAVFLETIRDAAAGREAKDEERAQEK